MHYGNTTTKQNHIFITLYEYAWCFLIQMAIKELTYKQYPTPCDLYLPVWLYYF